MEKKATTKGWTKKSIGLLGLAAQGNPEAQYEIGMRCLEGIEVPKDLKLAIEWLTKSSTQGFEDAQYLLGRCYESGTGVEENEKIALGLYIKAANAANKLAQHALGEYYYKEDKCNEAIEWYRKAAKQEYAPSQYELGRCYYLGIGAVKAEEMGLALIEKAANKKYKPAQVFWNKVK